MIEGPIVKGNKQHEVEGNNNMHPNRASNAVQQHLSTTMQFSAEHRKEREGRAGKHRKEREKGHVCRYCCVDMTAVAFTKKSVWAGVAIVRHYSRTILLCPSLDVYATPCRGKIGDVCHLFMCIPLWCIVWCIEMDGRWMCWSPLTAREYIDACICICVSLLQPPSSLSGRAFM